MLALEIGLILLAMLVWAWGENHKEGRRERAERVERIRRYTDGGE